LVFFVGRWARDPLLTEIDEQKAAETEWRRASMALADYEARRLQ
jgi:hypothetical protein